MMPAASQTRMKWSLFFVVLSAMTLRCVAEPTTITIRFANGRTGKPLKLKSYVHGETGLPSGSCRIDHVDGDQMTVTFQNVTVIQFRGEQFEPCDVASKKQQPPRYSLREIVDRGVVAPNFCGAAKEKSTPGQLLIYSRHEHWWKITSRVMQGLLICA